MSTIRMNDEKHKLVFIKSALKDLKQFPQGAKRKIGHDLDQIQDGLMPVTAKKLEGLSGVMELVERFDKDTYRAVYVVNISSTIYVLHCFKKKSKTGIKTPQSDIDLIKQQLKLARER